MKRTQGTEVHPPREPGSLQIGTSSRASPPPEPLHRSCTSALMIIVLCCGGFALNPRPDSALSGAERKRKLKKNKRARMWCLMSGRGSSLCLNVESDLIGGLLSRRENKNKKTGKIRHTGTCRHPSHGKQSVQRHCTGSVAHSGKQAQLHENNYTALCS